LTAQKIQLGGKDFEFRRVYFPKDPTKGLQITFREWNTPEVKDHQSGVLDGCRYTCNLWNWSVARQFIGIVDDDPDFEGPHRSLANVPLLVTPPLGGWSTPEIFSALGKSGDRGLPWSVGTTTKPQDTLKFLGTVPRRVMLGLVVRPAIKTNLIQRCYPGFDPSADGEGVYAKLYQQSRLSGWDVTWPLRIAVGDSNRIATMRLVVKDIIGVNDGELANVIDTICNLGDPPGGGTGHHATDTWAEMMAVKAAISNERAQELLNGRADPAWFTRKKKSKEADFRSARSQLGPGATLLLGELKARRYTELAFRVEAWLRTFLTVELQTAVSEVILAKLDASLSRPVEFGRDDRVAVLQPVESDSEESEDDEGDEIVNPDEE